MNTYPSTEVRPYVYIGIDPITGEFYIGYREANIKPSHIDLFEYKTSSDIVKLKFDQMNWAIVAEFLSGNDAFDFEQQLIAENWHNSLLLNKQYRLNNGKGRFKSQKGKGGPKKGTPSPKKGKSYEPQSVEHKKNIAAALIGKNKGRILGAAPKERGLHISKAKTGRSIGPASNRKMLEDGTHPSQQKKICEHCDKKISIAMYKRWHGGNCKQKGNIK